MFDLDVLRKRIKKAKENQLLNKNSKEGLGKEPDEKIEVVPKLRAPRGEIVDLLEFKEEPFVRVNVLESGKYIVFEPSISPESIDIVEKIKTKESIKWNFNFDTFLKNNKEAISKYTESNFPSIAYNIYKMKYGSLTPLLLDKEIKEVYNIMERVYVLREDRDYLTSVIITPQEIERLRQGKRRREVSLENGLKMIVDNDVTIIKDKEFNPIELLEYKFLPPEVLSYVWLAIKKKANILVVGPEFLSNSFRFFDRGIIPLDNNESIDKSKIDKKSYVISKNVDKELFKRMSYGFPAIIHLDLPNPDLSNIFEYLIKKGVNKSLFQFVDVVVIFSESKLKDVFEVTGYDFKTREISLNSAFRFNPLINKFEMNKISLLGELEEKEKSLFFSSIDFLEALLENKIYDNVEVQSRIKQFEEKFRQ